MGTKASEIFEISAEDGSNLHGNEPLLNGHYADELWGLAVHPSVNGLVFLLSPLPPLFF